MNPHPRARLETRPLFENPAVESIPWISSSASASSARTTDSEKRSPASALASRSTWERATAACRSRGRVSRRSGSSSASTRTPQACARSPGRARRERMPNVTYVRASIESLPAELGGIADRVTVVLPWGSLLAAVALPSLPALRNLRAVCQPGADARRSSSAATRRATRRSCGVSACPRRRRTASRAASMTGYAEPRDSASIACVRWPRTSSPASPDLGPPPRVRRRAVVRSAGSGARCRRGSAAAAPRRRARRPRTARRRTRPTPARPIPPPPRPPPRGPAAGRSGSSPSRCPPAGRAARRGSSGSTWSRGRCR